MSELPLSIIPSYPAPSGPALATILDRLAGHVEEFQVDVVEEDFAGVSSWPETEPDPLAALEMLGDWSDRFGFELDLMVREPVRYFSVCAKLGITKVVAHAKPDTDISDLIEAADQHGLSLSLGLSIDHPLESVTPYLKDGSLHAVQMMGIAEVGSQGQPFDERVLPRIRSLRQQFPDVSIAVDGAVNSETLPLLYAAGANRFAPGSAVVGSSDPAAAYEQLCTALK